MLDRPRLARNGRGLILLFAATFLTLSVLGYDPADPPGSGADPRGVASVGTQSPSMELRRRMWPNLFALARCRQFQVTRKSHLWYEASAR